MIRALSHGPVGALLAVSLAAGLLIAGTATAAPASAAGAP